MFYKISLTVLHSRDIDRQYQRFRIALPPGGIGPDAFLDDPAANGDDTSVFLRNRNKDIGADHVVVLILPADQCLHAPQLLIARKVLGLII